MTQDNNPLGKGNFMPNTRDHESYNLIRNFTLLEYTGPLREIFGITSESTPCIDGMGNE